MQFKLSILVVILILLSSCLLMGNAALIYYKKLLNIGLDPVNSKVYVAKNIQLKSQFSDAENKRVILFGDSRIRHWKKFPYLENVQFVNRGVGGETSAQSLYRLNKDVIDLMPDVVIIQIGINDLKAIGLVGDKKDEIMNATLKNIENLLVELNKHDIRTYILTVFPAAQANIFRSFFWSDNIDYAIEKINQLIRTIKLKNIKIIDCDPIFNKNGKMKKEFAIDMLHLNAAGYDILSKTIKVELEQFFMNIK